MRRFALLLGFALLIFTASAVAQNCDNFTDVLASSPFCADVTWVASYGITKGCAPSQFCPNENVTRLQMAAFLHRMGENPAFVDGGNAFGATATLGTTDDQTLNVIVGNLRAMMVQPVFDDIVGFNPNVVNGQPGNAAAPGIAGATIAGGGGCNPAFAVSCESASSNQVTGQFGTVGGGFGNSAAVYATVPGGDGNTASGSVSFAGGNVATASHNYSFVWSGWSTGGGKSFNESQFHVGGEHGLSVDYCSLKGDGSGGGTCWVYIGDIFGHAIDTYTGAFLSTGGIWTNSSDRALKTDFIAIDPQAVLTKVAQLPIDEWRYKAETGERHLGPVAQDFYAAFGLGADDKHIGTIDEGGVALAAIKGLYEQLQARDREIAALREELHAIKAALNLR